MARPLTRGEYLIGLQGLALLRLYSAHDASAADLILRELDDLRTHLDHSELARSERGEIVDVEVGYARWAQVYDQPGNPLIWHEDPIVLPLLDSFDADPVLDAGCGTGRHLMYLSKKGHSVIGVDPSSAMLAKAKEKVPDADVRLGSVTQLPVGDGEVGGVVCSFVLDHVEDLVAAFREFARVVRPGGRIVTSTMHPTFATMVGAGASFVDEAGRSDVATHPKPLSSHLNAAITAGLSVARCIEPTISSDTAEAFGTPRTKVGARHALTGVPILLVWEFRRS